MIDKHEDDHAKHGETDHAAKARELAAKEPAPKAEAQQVFPFSASINEPQTVSLPLPQGVEVPKPVISSLNPDSCAVGDPDFPLVVSGENFFGDSVIHFAGHDEPTTFDADAKTLSTGIKPSLWADPVTVQVMVKNGPELSAPVDFTFDAPATRKARK
jgi:hypothetical protein